MFRRSWSRRRKTLCRRRRRSRRWRLMRWPAFGRDCNRWRRRWHRRRGFALRRGWRRAVAFAGLEANRNRSVPPLVMAPTVEEFIARNQKAEAGVREFLERRGILTLPTGLQHFTLRPQPPYLAALGDFIEMDDFTSPSRLDQNGIRYVARPSPSAGYFWVADSKDSRLQIVQEGTVGHYGQLCASWKNPDPIRPHYYDSGANEGIGFYAEEMMLQSGLYDDSQHTREIVYNQMRLRALRVMVDVM